ncbi:MAG: hypothetical protein ACYDG2_00420 [Ruminiclostridium sp.]
MADMEYFLDNGIVRAEFSLCDGNLTEKYFKCDCNGNVLIAESYYASGLGSCKIAVGYDNCELLKVKDNYRDKPRALFGGIPSHYAKEPLPAVGDSLPRSGFKVFDCERIRAGTTEKIIFHTKSGLEGFINRTISLEDGKAYFRISNNLKLEADCSLEYFTDKYYFSSGNNPDFTWTPLLKMDPSCVSSDWTFKAPAAIMQKKTVAMSIIPDLKSIKMRTGIDCCNLGIDMDIKTEKEPVISYGFIPSVPRYHSSFIHPQGLCEFIPGGKALSYEYFLLLDNNAQEKRAYKQAVSFLWEKFGHDNFIEGYDVQHKSFNLWEKEAWHGIGSKVWFEFDYAGEKCGGFRDYLFSMNDDVWFYGWWNNLRTAYGLALYSKRREDAQKIDSAYRVLNLAINAPRKEGAFPVVFLQQGGEQIWTASASSNFGGFRDQYHLFSMAWTAYWLLKWKNDIVIDDQKILPLSIDFGDFLIKHQEESGLIPSFFKESDLSADETLGLNRVNAEGSVGAVFLLELYRTVNDSKYLEAAIKAMDYIEREIMPLNKWFDFETFLSCSYKPYEFYDDITGQYPQCNMGIIFSSQAYLDLYRITGKQRYLELGNSVLDYLSLYQQVWSHPMFELNLIGGFTTQNTDGEWSDARQGYCAVIYFDYFEQTGMLEYFERAVAALRASLAVSPYENWSHHGYNDEPGVFSTFNWGLGSGMATIEMVWEKYGDVHISVAGKWAYGINGCTVSSLDISTGEICMDIESSINWTVPLRLVFRDLEDGMYMLKINREMLGTFNDNDLKRGIMWNYIKGE